MAVIRPDLDAFVAGLPEVNHAVKGAANDSAARVKGAIAPHNRTGRLYRSVKVTRANGKDYWVTAETDYVIPTNFGFWHVFAQEKIRGIFYMKAGL